MLIFVAPAHAFDLNVNAKAGIDAQVGLDGPTRALLQRLPAEIRKEIVESVRQSLDILDTHVATYLAQVDAIVANRINDLACKSTAATDMIATTIAEKILDSRTTHVEDLLNDVRKTRAGFSASDTPETYRVRYADLLARSVLRYCQVVLSSEAAEEVGRIQDRIRPLWNAWARLDGQCETAKDCFSKLRGDTLNLVASANAWDKTQINAQERIQAVPDVPSPSLWARFSGMFDPQSYETEFVNMFAIQDELRVTQELRQSSARRDIDDAKTAVAQAQAALEAATAHLREMNRPSQRAAMASAASVSRDNDSIAAKLNNAVETWSEMSDEASELSKRFKSLQTTAESVRQRAEVQESTLEAIERFRDSLPPNFPFPL
ncbi:MAG: hypothetical protein E5Y58_05355 [Mesorhizobium sp.]|nr:MAG: hypothetical protein E5Y58_05355 [Mesorhizobium sp.]